MPRVGIVIPAFNSSRFIDATMASITAQTFTDWACVICDDGSSDETPVIVGRIQRSDTRVATVSQKHCGISAARNAGFAALPDCEFVTFTDHDDTWRPDHLATLLDAAARPGVIGAHSVAETIDENGAVVPGFAGYMRARAQPGRRRFEPVSPSAPTTLGTALFVNRVYPPGVLLAKRAAYEVAGAWNPHYTGVQDWDMLLRLLEQGPIAFVDRVTVGYRQHGGNESNDRHRNVAETRALHVEAFERLAPTIGRQNLRRWWRQWEVEKLREARRELPSSRAAARLLNHSLRYVRGWPSAARYG